MDEDSHAARAVTQRFVRGLGIGVLGIIASLGLADRVNATYLHVDGAPTYAGDYIDRGWYYLLDDGQYYYLDRGQYNLMGELGYLLGHPCYPKLFERELDQAVGFTNRVNTGWFSISGGQVPISEYAVWSYHFNAGEDESIFFDRFLLCRNRNQWTEIGGPGLRSGGRGKSEIYLSPAKVLYQIIYQKALSEEDIATSIHEYTIAIPTTISTALHTLIARWKFDEAEGSEARDSSGNNLVGTLFGNPQWLPSGGKFDDYSPGTDTDSHCYMMPASGQCALA